MPARRSLHGAGRRAPRPISPTGRAAIRATSPTRRRSSGRGTKCSVSSARPGRRHAVPPHLASAPARRPVPPDQRSLFRARARLQQQRGPEPGVHRRLPPDVGQPARLLAGGADACRSPRDGGYRIAVGLKPTPEELNYNRRGRQRLAYFVTGLSQVRSSLRMKRSRSANSKLALPAGSARRRAR